MALASLAVMVAPVGKAIVKAFMDKITARESGQAVGEKKEDAHGAAPKQ
jgi:hypothetical protein